MSTPDTTFLGRLKRALRHWRTTAAVGRRAFPPETLDAIGKAITAGELSHRGELRLIVENSMPFDVIWTGLTNRQRAVALFAEYGIWDTEDNCGVLIYINLAEHKVDIVTDRSIARKVDNATWQAICSSMAEGFRRGDFHGAVLHAVDEVNALLAQHFPSNGARANELPDHPMVL